MSSKIAVGQCPACHKLHYATEDVGQSCKQTKPCLGIVRPYEQSPDTIDGNKVIDFARAVQNLGKMFEEINIGAIHKCFIVGQKLDTVDKLVEQEKLWQATMESVVASLAKSGQFGAYQIKELKAMVAFSDHARNVINNPTFGDAVARLKQFSDLLDNIERHRLAGTVDIISQLSKTS